MKKHIGKIFLGVVVIILMVAAFFSGDESPEHTSVEPIVAVTDVQSSKPTETDVPDETTTADETPISEKTPEPVIPATTEEEPQQPNEELTCTLTVDCISVYNNMDLLSADKRELVPPQGIIYGQKTLTFAEGESVFDVLRREMVNNGIHFEFVYTPMYDSVYIEGIGNIYEFDCGSRSGWMYRVNGVKQNVGSSQYKLKSGDNIRVYYTCNFFEER